MEKLKPEDYYDSLRICSRWREGTFLRGQCQYQIFGDSVLIEKWIVINKDNSTLFLLLEIYPYGRGFQIYQITNR